MSNFRLACIGALVGPVLALLLYWTGASPFDEAFDTETLIQAHVTGALLAVTLFGK